MAKSVTRPVESWWYVLRADRSLKEEEQSRFLLSPLTAGERTHALDSAHLVTADAVTGERRIHDRGFQQARSLVLGHLEDVQNFPSVEPRAWPAKGSRTDKERYLDLLDDLDVFELGNEILDRSVLGVAEKN